MDPTDVPLDDVVARLRASGSVFAEDEAAILVRAAADAGELESLVSRRVAGAPLEPLVGRVRFGRLDLEVGPGVFVPRQRSRRLAHLAVRRMRQRVGGEGSSPAPVMLEPYCGVAPLAATVAASVPRAEVHAADVDAAALAYARRNLPEGAGVHVADGLAGLPSRLRGRIDVIAAVPPYVPGAELELMPREAREFEPAAALVGGGADGLDHVRRIVRDAGSWTAPGGSVLVELHAAQLVVAARAARPAGWTVRIHPPSASRTGVLELVAGSEPIAG
ncbi:methyltransferase [Agromyces tropicus]|uniref:Methyltransferase n=1 Tax=Agromyces tropicus TaxID=555371 RepID=A0ABN2U9K4_9MICO